MNRYYAPIRVTFENQIRGALSRMLTNPWESGKRLEKARQILGDRKLKNERRVLQAVFNCYVMVHEQIPLAWNGER